MGVDDGSGVIPIDIAGGGAVELKQTFRETKKEGMFADLKNAVGKGKPIMFGSYAFQNPINSAASEFECKERIFTADSQLYAAGWVKEGVLTGRAIFSSSSATKAGRNCSRPPPGPPRRLSLPAPSPSEWVRSSASSPSSCSPCAGRLAWGAAHGMRPTL